LHAGIPSAQLYAHQIPGEVLTGGESEDFSRTFSSASPAWTGLLDNDHVGITRFGPIDPTIMAQYLSSNGSWGIFEWHPMPNVAPASPALYNATITALQSYSRHRANVLFPGWWTLGPGDPTFPFRDSMLAKGLHDYLAGCPNEPWPVVCTPISSTLIDPIL
jgi:hypothetical protein